jgi:hypothetical protein
MVMRMVMRMVVVVCVTRRNTVVVTVVVRMGRGNRRRRAARVRFGERGVRVLQRVLPVADVPAEFDEQIDDDARGGRGDDSGDRAQERHHRVDQGPRDRELVDAGLGSGDQERGRRALARAAFAQLRGGGQHRARAQRHRRADRRSDHDGTQIVATEVLQDLVVRHQRLDEAGDQEAEQQVRRGLAEDRPAGVDPCAEELDHAQPSWIRPISPMPAASSTSFSRLSSRWWKTSGRSSQRQTNRNVPDARAVSTPIP